MMNQMQKIKSNKIRCNQCNDIIESKRTHEFVTCSCGRVSVDGGLSYLRRCFTDSTDDYEDLSEYENDV